MRNCEQFYVYRFSAHLNLFDMGTTGTRTGRDGYFQRQEDGKEHQETERLQERKRRQDAKVERNNKTTTDSPEKSLFLFL